MQPRIPRPYIPEDFIEKIIVAAINTGKLGNYLFDNQTSRMHTVLRRAVNTAVTFPPLKAFLLAKPIQSSILRLLRADKRA